jgi:hypothetical protein
MTDGVIWHIEGLRDGEKYAIVRHEPNDASIKALCAEVMRMAGKAEDAPRP